MHCKMGDEVGASYFVLLLVEGGRSWAVEDEDLLVISTAAFGLARGLPSCLLALPLHMDSSVLSGGGYQTVLWTVL